MPKKKKYTVNNMFMYSFENIWKHIAQHKLDFRSANKGYINWITKYENHNVYYQAWGTGTKLITCSQEITT